MPLVRFLRNCQGSAAPMLALAAIPLMGFIGAGVDFGRAVSVRATMQNAADTTALMLAKELNGIQNTQLGTQAQNYFKANFQHPDGSDVGVTATSGSAGTVTVSAASSVPTKFMGTFGFATISIAARSTAFADSDGLGCVLALDPNSGAAVSAQGSTSVTLNGCSLYANSANTTAISVGGSARLTALSVSAVGGVSGLSNIVTTQGVKTGAGALADPYADVSYPNFYGCSAQDFTAKSTITIDPGVYCGGMKLNAGAQVTLNPGVYYLDGGELNINGGASLSGTGVTLVFTSKNRTDWPTATINGNASVYLTAPKVGQTTGIVVFGDRGMPTGTSLKFNGGVSQYFGGAIYAPTGNVDFTGGAATSTSCTQLIANTITYSGNSSFAINCSSYGTRPFSPHVVRLVS